jgi:exodeoxyribonuclease V alpha subunit
MKALSAAFETALGRAGMRAVDIALADWGLRHGGGQAGALGLALCSLAVSRGNTCLYLDDEATRTETGATLMDPSAFREALATNPLVATPADDATRPLIRDGDRLYLQRYWAYEAGLAERLSALMAAPPAEPDPETLLASGLFQGPDAAGEPDWQAVAAFVAQRHRLAVISGGPGTGKTYTVVRLLIQRLRSARANGEPMPIIRLTAPTGKAAARLMASVRGGLGQLAPEDAVVKGLPDEASTLHRLLRMRPDSVQPGHDAAHPLPADLVVVDEASMVDLPLMAKLTDALPAGAQLILLGDRYQLASVESGAILSDLCSAAGINAFSDAQRAAAGRLLGDATGEAPAHGIGDHVVTLRTSHRFRADRPIGRLAAAINAGDPDAVDAVLGEGSDEVIADTDSAAETVTRTVAALAAEYAVLHEASDPERALDHLDGLRLLTATRIGPLGSERLNERIARTLAERYGFDPLTRWYHARPVIIGHNEPRAGLYNGDTGIVWRDTGGLRVWFRTEDGLRAFDPSVLPAHESVYAMTVHKAQGSEFESVYLILPGEASPVLSRELLYTAVTRARSRLTVVGEPAIWHAGIANRIRRESGLTQRLLT